MGDNHGIKELPKILEENFYIKKTDKNGNTKFIEKEDEVAPYVERFVPKDIREFYFFDGERLDNYFRSATSQKIKRAVFLISQIDLLENRVERKLYQIIKDFQKEAGKKSPKIEEIRNNLNNVEQNLANINEKVKNSKTQIETYEGLIDECRKKIANIPDVIELNNRRMKLTSAKNHNESILDEKITKKENLLFESSKIIMIWPAIKRTLESIKDKRGKNEIPPKVDEMLLVDILNNNVCSICGTQLNDNLRRKINELKNRITISSKVIQELLNIENPLYFYKKQIDLFENEIRIVSEEIDNYKRGLKEIEEELGKIDKRLMGFDEEKVREWYQELKTYNKNKTNEQDKLADSRAQKKGLMESFVSLRKQLNEEIKKKKKFDILGKEMDFCNRSIEVIKKVKEGIMIKTKEKISSQTNNLFFDLIWKDSTFKEINIDNDYNINLIHNIGYDCLGSTGAAEREILALSFILALHSVSGFDAPIMVDTPVARIDDKHRENFGNVFSQVSLKDKQVILLFTPSEYSKDLSKIIDIICKNRFRLTLSSDENEVKLEVI